MDVVYRVQRARARERERERERERVRHRTCLLKSDDYAKTLDCAVSKQRRL